MYTPDIVNLRYFYSTAFGESVRALIADAIIKIWPSVSGDVTLGLGYATPYLPPYIGQATPLVACMPAQQGAAYWPHDGDNIVLIAHDSELPFPESSINRVLLVHSIENSEQLSWMIQEIWRILAPGGKLLAVVPNRRGMWSRSSKSPFGYGRPFSITQLCDLLGEHQFTIIKKKSALFMPPVRIKFCWKVANKLESIGRFFCSFLGGFFGGFGGGILLVEAEKQIYSGIRQPVVEARNYRGSVSGARTVMTMD